MKCIKGVVAASAIFSLASCGGGGGGHDATGDITFNWSFDGQDCGPADVDSVGVQIYDGAGNTVTTDSVPCGAETATYTDFSTGEYSFSLTGFAPDGTALYEADGPIRVYEGANDFDVNLSLTSS